MKNKIAIISVVSFWIDQIIKYVVYKNVLNVTLIPGFLSLIYVENRGIAFSLFPKSRMIVILVSILIIFFLFYEINELYVKKNKENKVITLSFGLLLGGILGNLVDRIIRGYVIDYVSISFFNYHLPIFNVADVFICVSAIILLGWVLINDNRKLKKNDSNSDVFLPDKDE